MCQLFKKKLNGNKGLLITFIISMIFGIVMLIYRNDTEKIRIIAAIEKMLTSFTTLVVLCCDNTNLSLIQEANNIVSSIPDRIRIIEKLCKLVIIEKEDKSQGKLVPEEDVSQGKLVQEIEGVSQGKLVPKIEDVTQGKSVPEIEDVSQGKSVSEIEGVSQGKSVLEVEGVSQGKSVLEVEGVSQGKSVPEGLFQGKLVEQKEGVSQVKIGVKKEGVSQCKIVAEKKCISQGKMNREGMSTEEDRKKDSEIAFKILSSIYDGEKNICTIIENITKKKII